MPKTISAIYPLWYLANHPQTKGIILKYKPESVDTLDSVDGTLEELLQNMGGGFRYGKLISLIEEIDSLPTPLIPEFSEVEMRDIIRLK